MEKTGLLEEAEPYRSCTTQPLKEYAIPWTHSSQIKMLRASGHTLPPITKPTILYSSLKSWKAFIMKATNPRTTQLMHLRQQFASPLNNGLTKHPQLANSEAICYQPVQYLRKCYSLFTECRNDLEPTTTQ